MRVLQRLNTVFTCTTFGQIIQDPSYYSSNCVNCIKIKCLKRKNSQQKAQAILRTVLLIRTQWIPFNQTEICSFQDLYSTLIMEQISFPECLTHFNFTTSFFKHLFYYTFFENFVHECCVYISPCTPPQLLPIPDTPQLYALFCSQSFLWATSS